MKETIKFDTKQLTLATTEYEPILLVIDGPCMGDKHPLKEGTTCLGRGEACDIVINSSIVSLKHLEIKRIKNNVSVSDVNSTNGTYLNKTILIPDKEYAMNDGDMLIVGNIVLKFFSSKDLEVQFFETLYEKTIIDPLTSVYNKRFLMDMGDSEFKRAKRYGRNMCLAMLDLDHFKRVNDTFGHQVGDFVLKSLTDLIKHNIRKQDIVARYGGEEFVLITVESTIEQAYIVTERIRKAVEKLAHVVNDSELKITISIGLAALTDDVKSLSELIELADKALYFAKNNGRNQVNIYTENK